MISKCARLSDQPVPPLLSLCCTTDAAAGIGEPVPQIPRWDVASAAGQGLLCRALGCSTGERQRFTRRPTAGAGSRRPRRISPVSSGGKHEGSETLLVLTSLLLCSLREPPAHKATLESAEARQEPASRWHLSRPIRPPPSWISSTTDWVVFRG